MLGRTHPMLMGIPKTQWWLPLDTGVVVTARSICFARGHRQSATGANNFFHSCHKTRHGSIRSMFVPRLFVNFGSSTFLLRSFKMSGAEGGLFSNTLFLPFLLGICDFLRKPARFVFRTVRTVGTVGTQLYLSCS